ncbi:MAG: PorT family protein [Bacteroidales bacterium]|nr:PorT family protein [Bacteroidales bacterium]
MKKLVIAATLLVAGLFMAENANAQSGFGVIAGMNFNSAKIKDIDIDAKAGWSIGGTYLLNLPLGFSLQPSLVYSQKSADLVLGTQTLGAINLPVSVQWGPDLIIARPFIDVTPYIGYSLFNKFDGVISGEKIKPDGKNAFDYGIGIGAGLNVWKLQAIVRYNWNFGPLGSLKDFTGIDVKSLDVKDTTFGGITFTVAYIF